MVADGLTKNKGDPVELLRSLLESGFYQIADEEGWLLVRGTVGVLRHACGMSIRTVLVGELAAACAAVAGIRCEVEHGRTRSN